MLAEICKLSTPNILEFVKIAGLGEASEAINHLLATVQAPKHERAMIISTVLRDSAGIRGHRFVLPLVCLCCLSITTEYQSLVFLMHSHKYFIIISTIT